MYQYFLKKNKLNSFIVSDYSKNVEGAKIFEGKQEKI